MFDEPGVVPGEGRNVSVGDERLVGLHGVLLGLTGRVSDEFLATARWQLAEGGIGRVAESVCQELAAGGVALTFRQMGVLAEFLADSATSMFSRIPTGDEQRVLAWHFTGSPAGSAGVGKTGKRFSVNAMCAIGNKGELYFTVYTGSFNGKVFLRFLDRLTRHLDRKVHLIVDGHPVHRRKTIQQWITKHAEAIEMHFLPGYSPELNPDEILNADLKRTMSTSTAPKTRDELKQAVRSFLHRLQKLPDRVRSYFGKPEVRYAA
ncbi:IS630 family transposase [Saccharopolyspora sp. ASAGF58]|uniref:IS630 family transposase n=1 Tax=Saccharopolyspora sp. ASAGF58 TaxID=2719023 RepID=UPI001440037B|nr:IS630 family transposase [Saccharopolyspora sp. ASAGF58]QIZ39160.1 IS630 family transposase [Saccharopolyspora sp. ASAGF58]